MEIDVILGLILSKRTHNRGLIFSGYEVTTSKRLESNRAVIHASTSSTQSCRCIGYLPPAHVGARISTYVSCAEAF